MGAESLSVDISDMCACPDGCPTLVTINAPLLEYTDHARKLAEDNPHDPVELVREGSKKRTRPTSASVLPVGVLDLIGPSAFQSALTASAPAADEVVAAGDFLWLDVRQSRPWSGPSSCCIIMHHDHEASRFSMVHRAASSCSMVQHYRSRCIAIRHDAS